MLKTNLFSVVLWLPLAVVAGGGLQGCNDGGATEDTDSACIGITCPGRDTDDPDADTDTTVDDTDKPDTDVVDTDTDTVDTTDTDTGDSDVVDSDTNNPDTFPPDSDTIDSDSDTVPNDTGIDTDIKIIDGKTMQFGDLVLSEVMVTPSFDDCSNEAYGQYIEMKNATDHELNLQFVVVRYGARSFTVTSQVLVQPGAYAIGRPSFAACAGYLPSFHADFTYSSNIVFTSAGSNTTLSLLRPDSVTIDTVNFSTWQFGPSPERFTRGYSVHLTPGKEDASSNDFPDSWCLADELLGIDIPGKSPSYGTPARQAHGCTAIVGPIDTDDSDVVVDTDTATPVKPGDLVINEVNLNPLGCPNPDEGRYIEIYNNTDKSVDLRDFKIDWGTIKDLSIGKRAGSNWLLGPREFTAIQRSSSTGCYNYGNRFTVNNSLSPTGKRVVLHTVAGASPAVVVDEVDMSTWVFPNGRAMGFDPDALIATPYLNPLRSLWCPQQNYIAGGVRDRGTPSEPNNSCTPGGGTDTDTDLPPEDPCFTALSRNVNNGLDPDELCRGELMITELHLDPKDCGGSPSQGQYLELYNASGYTVHLRSGLLIDLSSGAAEDIEPIGAAVTDVAPGQYFTVQPKQFQAYCHDFAHRFDLATSGKTFTASSIQIQNGQQTEIDRVDFSGWSFQKGIARQLMPEIPLVLSPNYDLASFNDDQSLWCVDGPSMNPFGSLDHGTPAAMNDCNPDGPVDDTDLAGDTFVPDPHTNRDITDGISPEELYEGELLLTEVMIDPVGCGGGTNARFFELYNNTNSIMHLNGLQVAVGGNTAGTLVKTGSSDDLPGGARTIISMSSQFAFCFPSMAPKWELSGATLDASRVRLFNSTISTIDAVDFTGWSFTQGRSLQFDPTVNPSFLLNNLPDRWCDSDVAILGTTSDFGSAGTAGHCWDRVVSDTDDGGPPPLTLDQLPRATTTLLITEIMSNPHCADAKGEYVEVYNNFPGPVDLFGLRLRVNTFGPATVVTTHQVVAGNGYATLARTNAARCYVTEPTASYPSTWEMRDIGDRYDLTFTDSGGFTVYLNSVNTAGWAVPPTGQALQLNATKYNYLANTFEVAWCPTPAISTYNLTPASPTLLDFGTPGRPNDGCPVLCDSADSSCLPPDTDTPETDIQVEPDLPLPGELVITEFMAQPGDCSPDATAEYIEVYNTTLKPLSLRYLTVNDEEGLATTQFSAAVPSHGYAVLLNSHAGTNQCYGLQSNAWYDGAVLNNNGDVITLTNEFGQVIDSVDFNSFPSAFGTSWELGAGLPLTAAGNDAANKWCTSTTLIPGGVGDRGTPGAVNTCTPPSVLPPVCPTDPNTNIKGACELVPGDLVITEIMANSAEALKPNDPATEWVEVYNASGQTVNLRGVEIANRFGALATSAINDDVYVPSKRRAVLARFHAGGRLYNANASATYSRPLFDNQGDIVQLRVGPTLIDQVDYRTWPDEQPGEALSLSGNYLTATSNDAPWAWCPAITPIPGAQDDLGTPGSANPRCASLIVDTSVPPPGPLDADTLVDPGYPDTDSWVHTGTALTLGQLGPSDLVITELMVDPIDCTDGASEYIELRNNRSVDVDLNGLKITTSSGTFTLNRSVIVGPHRFALGVPGGVANCYDLPSDFEYTGLKLVNVSDTVTLAGPTFAFDTVNTSVFPVRTTGASWNLDPTAFTASLNDVGGNWCPSPDVIPGGQLDRGTPGYANAQCITTYDPDTQPSDTFDTFTPSPDPAKPMSDVKVGELLITEIMVDPRDCSDENAEYVEVYNNGTQPIDLNGLVVSDGARTYTVAALPAHLVIQPGDYYLARRAAVNECYTLRTKFRYTSLAFGQAGSVAFIANQTKVIDLVDFGLFAPAPGHAYTLSPTKVAATPPSSAVGEAPASVVASGTYSNVYLHNRAADWCTGWLRFSGSLGDKGSPGKANDACVPDGQLPPYPADYVANVEELDANQLAITEFMADARACPDLFGEYIELRNTYPFTVDLFGMHIRTGSTDTVVSSHREVAPNALTLIRKVGGSSACYFGVNADILTNFVLSSYGNAGDTVALTNSHSTLDLVDYSTFSVRTGEAFSVTAGHETATGNDSELNWCFEASTIAGTADKGSPGQTNGVCASPAFVRNVGSLVPGDLVISEIMIRPHDCYGNNENYIEVTNITGDTLDLNGLRVGLQGGTSGAGASWFTVDQPLIVAPGTEAVLTHLSACLARHVQSDFSWTYPDLQYLGEPIVLDDGAGGPILDTVSTVNWTLYWTGANDGHAFQLMPDRINTTANDSPANWCQAKVRIRGTNTGGTPGAPNDCVTDNLGETVLDTADTDVVVVDTDYFKVAMVRGRATVAPNAVWLGTMDRVVQVTQASALDWEGIPLRLSADCYLQYNVHQVRPLATTSLCPSCEFGFEVAMDTRRDLLSSLYPGAYSDLTTCGAVFASLGGLPQRLPNKKMFFSSTYGALYYQDAAGTLVRYSDEASFQTTGRLDYRKYLYRLPY